MTNKGVRFTVVAAVLAVAAAVVLASSSAGTATSTYLVLYKASAVPNDAADTISKAGGTLLASYDQIGVAVASSSDATFAAAMRANSKVEGVSATAGVATRVTEELERADAGSVATASSWGDPLSGFQWDMVQIHVPEAYAINPGSRSVVVGDIDTGLDFTHPDLAPNYDASRSVDCTSGAPAPLLPGNDVNGHGTHTAGTIAAAKNGIGIVGVAPNVKIAGIKAGNDDGFFFPEAVICAFMWAGSKGIDVTNNSYFADPWLFNCRNDPEQRAIWKAEQRAIRWAMEQGVTVVAAQGNENIDLSKRNVDTTSPDYPPGSEQQREVTNACVVIPVEIPGVVGVTADGYNLQKAYYSSYGVGVAQATAPGGDRRFQIPPTGNGRVLSTVPGGYAYAQGTSMASPHAAGVAALIVSTYGKMSPGAVAAKLANTADPMACPQNPFNPGPPFIFEAICVGGNGYNGFYGHGQVNALSAVS